MEVIDPETLREYVVVGAGMHREAMEALRRQQNLEAIASGFPKAIPYPPKVQVFHFVIRDRLPGIGSRSTPRAVFTFRDNSVFVLAVRRSCQDRIHRELIGNLPEEPSV